MAIISGGQTLSTTNLTDLLDGGASTLHSHATSAGVPKAKVSSIFEAYTTTYSRRNTITNVAGGTGTYDNIGIELNTSSTISSSSKIATNVGSANGIEKDSPTLTIMMQMGINGSDVQSLLSIGDATTNGSGITYTHSHAGFKIVRVSSGTRQLFALQADGTTENASSALRTIGQAVGLDLIIQLNGTTSGDYYSRMDSGALSSATNLTSNFSGNAGGLVFFAISNAGVADESRMAIRGFTYER